MRPSRLGLNVEYFCAYSQHTAHTALGCWQVNYSTRFALPQIIQEIADNVGLSPEQKATLLAAFFPIRACIPPSLCAPSIC